MDARQVAQMMRRIPFEAPILNLLEKCLELAHSTVAEIAHHFDPDRRTHCTARRLRQTVLAAEIGIIPGALVHTLYLGEDAGFLVRKRIV